MTAAVPEEGDAASARPAATARGPRRLVPRGLDPAERRLSPTTLALGASVAWLVVLGAYAIGFFAGGAAAPAPQPQALTVLLFLLGAAGPVLLMVVAAMLLNRAEALRAEIAALRSGLGAPVESGDPARFARQAAEQSRLTASRLSEIEKTLAGVAEALGGVPADAARPERRTAPAPRPGGGAEQPALPFSEAAEAAPTPRIPWADIVRALDFPRDAEDRAGFDAVRSAIRDPDVARLLQAAEDVLSMLAADGLHMEDFVPEHATVSAWRAYGEGVRGAKVAAVGGVRDEAALTRVRERVRGDAIFRDAALVFIRRWNQLIGRVLAEMGEDPTLRDIADTRSGRAFMLAARALGAFD